MNTNNSIIDRKQQISAVDFTIDKNPLLPVMITGPQVCQVLGYTEKDAHPATEKEGEIF